MNNNKLERMQEKSLWPNLRHYSSNFLEEKRKAIKTSVRIDDI
jgi:hypothetical protein